MNERLRSADYFLLGAFCIVLFGYAMFSGSPLSLHSARLPECSREMMANHDWLIPRSGGRPWLERPPLPHWITIGISAVLGQACDQVWVVRLPPAIMGTLVVLITAWVASVAMGRRIALCTGYSLATAYEFWRYSTLSEDDIFLAAIVVGAIALFFRAEFVEPAASDKRLSILGTRPWAILGFFALAGLTNLAKGALVGAVVVLAPVGVFLLWNLQIARIRRYLWLWGVVAFFGLTIFWPYMIYRRYPATVHNWTFDYSETDQYDQPIWYYLVQLPGVFMPWSIFAIIGLWHTTKDAFKTRGSFARFLWCWAIVPVLVLSIPHRKHHHYLVPSLAPWGVLAGIGITCFADWLSALRSKGLAFNERSGAIAFGSIIVGLLIIYCVGSTIMPDAVSADTAFLRHVDRTVPRDELLTINSDLGGEMDFFRNQFYVRPNAVLLHNLSFLRDDHLRAPDVYVITRASDREKLASLGEVEEILQSAKTRRERSPADRFTLFHLTFRPDLQRYPATPPDQITTMQAMDRAPGPWCGPPM